MISFLLRHSVWLAGLLGILCLPVSAGSSERAGSQFVAVVDAGSSGSRIYLYDAKRGEKRGRAEVLMEYESNAPGLSSFKANPAEAGPKGLGPLLQRLSEFLASKNTPNTDVKIHVLATAGMRLLENNDQRTIFENIAKYVQDNGFGVGDIETISGDMEGVYSWTDVNFLLEKFQNNQPTVGIIEVGGASAQIAFETTSAEARSTTIVIDQKKHSVFVQSFLGLGRNEARKRMVQMSEAGIHGNPCYPQGLIVDDQKAGAIGLSGNFNYRACVTAYEKMLGGFDIGSVQRVSRRGPDSFAAVGAGNPVGTFLGLLDAWKIASTNPFEIANIAELNCVKPWSRFEAEFGGAVFNKTQCADSAFIVTFLYGDRELNLSKTAVRSYKSIHGTTPTWTRGFVILKYLQ